VTPVSPTASRPAAAPAARRGRQRGSVSVETLMVTLLVVLVVLTGFQVMLLFAGRNAARDAANAAVIAGAVERGSVQAADAEAKARLERAGGSNLLFDPSVQVRVDDGTVTCTVSGEILSLVPLVPITVHQTATAPLERFSTPD
jgi:Flp pilus assembly protein TadG